MQKLQRVKPKPKLKQPACVYEVFSVNFVMLPKQQRAETLGRFQRLLNSLAIMVPVICLFYGSGYGLGLRKFVFLYGIGYDNNTLHKKNNSEAISLWGYF